jgi:high-affinity nickel-transport protein
VKKEGAFWGMMDTLNRDENFGEIGFIIIGIFALSWVVSIAIYRLNDYDSIDVRPPTNLPLT